MSGIQTFTVFSILFYSSSIQQGFEPTRCCSAKVRDQSGQQSEAFERDSNQIF
jgi:hypothetical protein